MPTSLDLVLQTIKYEYQVLKDNPEINNPEAFSDFSFDELIKKLESLLIKAFEEKEQELGSELMSEAGRHLFLRSIDEYWVEHLQGLDSLKEGIHLRGYGNKQPIVEYKTEALILFDNLINNIRRQACQWIFRVEKFEKAEREKIYI